MNWQFWLLAPTLSFLATILWVLTILGLPGNWGLLILAAGLSFLTAESHALHVDMGAVVGILVLSIAGEIAEFFAGAVGVSKLGGSRKGTILAIAGSVIGAVAGLFLGIPIPVIGSLISAVALGGAGAFGGAVLGERWDGKDWPLSIRIGWGALWGKLLGTLLKLVCGTFALMVLLIAIWS